MLFFWAGCGGSLLVINLDTRMSLAYVMNRIAEPSGIGGDQLMGDRRANGILAPVYRCVSRRS